MSLRILANSLLAMGVIAGTTAAGSNSAGLTSSGKPDIQSAGPLAIGPKGVLFLGDPRGAAIFAVGVEPTAGKPVDAVKLEGIDKKIAALLGTSAGDILIQDVAVHPESGVIYLSVSRGRGPDSKPVLVAVDGSGKLAEVPLDNVAFAKTSIGNAPAVDAKDQRGNNTRQESITDLAYVDGQVIVAGLSNEEFASKLRSIAFPFSAGDEGASVEVYHGAHGKFETRSPVRTFVPFVAGGDVQIVAAYTCTPLVRFPLSQLKPGVKIRGTTVAELGNRNRPLDIITYAKDGKNYLLLANNSRGVMKIPADDIAKADSITQPVKGTAGIAYETIADLKGVEQLDRWNDASALVLVRTPAGELNLETIALP